MTDVTQILNAIEQGDQAASDKLLPLVYDELRCLARQLMAKEKPGQTLQATALVHEAFLRLVDSEQIHNWNGRNHFFCAAAQSMRRILIESARRKKRIKRGGEFQRQELIDFPLSKDMSADDLIALDEALDRLEKSDPVKAEIVQLKFFAGLDHKQLGKLLGFSEVTARRQWRYARAWLRREMGRDLND